MLIDLIAREPADKLEAEWLKQLSGDLFDFCSQADNDWEQLRVEFGEGGLLLSILILDLQVGSTLSNHVEDECV